MQANENMGAALAWQARRHRDHRRLRDHPPKGTLVIRAAELLGIEVPRFCDHPLLDPAGACRQCLVEIEGQPKPPASCTTVCTDGMVVPGSFGAALQVPAVRTDLQVLGALAEMDVHLGLPDVAAARRELSAGRAGRAGRASRGIGWSGAGPGGPGDPGGPGAPGDGAAAGCGNRADRPHGRVPPGPGQALLATSHNLLDAGRMQDDEPNLAGTARAVAKMSASWSGEQQPFLVRGLAQHLRPEVAEHRLQLRGGPPGPRRSL